MNTTLFDQATVRYKNKDYRGALRTYTACLQDNTVPFSMGEVGLIYHRIGNCLVKLKNHNEAIQAYTQALSDQAYDARGSLQNNIGMAYASLRDYANAADHFQAAIDDESYDAPYKAYMGLGNAELKMGKSAEAGVAFREAALDESNPDPSKALLNLGICFMSLDRPQDAILSYESALQFDMTPDTRNRVNASMGQAYVANGQMQEAVDAFGRATADATYVLSDSASVDYQHALSEVQKMASAAEALQAAADMSGLDVPVDGAYGATGADATQPFFYDEELQDRTDFPGYADAYDGTGTSFFETTDAQLEQLSRNMAKKDRRNRNVGLKVLVVIIVLVILAMAAAVFGYMQGLGFPSQETVVQQLFNDPKNAGDDVFASGLSEESKASMVAPLVQDSAIEANGMNTTPTDSVAYVTADTGKGGQVMYKVTLVRDFIGWKISGVDLYFPSQNQ